MALTVRAEHRCFDGRLGFYSRPSPALGLEARFAVFLPAEALAGEAVPALYALAGLTCDEQTFVTKSGILRAAAAHGLAVVASDTSPRGAAIADEDEDWDFGTGAGFYLDATEPPWSAHYRMGSHVSRELPAWAEAEFAVAPDRRGVIGHSMGGHGALVLGLREPGRWQSVSALSPIAHPAAAPWGEKAFARYLGPDRARWAAHDACLLLRDGHVRPDTILVDQGEADQFLAEQLRPDALAQAAALAGQALTLRRHPGYDHSYWFVQSVIADHLSHHARLLRR